MSYSIAALAVAAHRAKDVASLVDAARVLTFLANARARDCLSHPQPGVVAARLHVDSIYRTAAALAAYGRELATDTEALLVAAESARPELAVVDATLDCDVETLRTLLVASMAEAQRAIDMLGSIQEVGAEELQAGTLGAAALVERQRAADALIERLRRG
jgi:hypothetical protein